MIKERNNSIDIFRLIASIMVMMIHFHPFSDINETIGYLFANIFPRIAVPFFFVVSGYYYNSKLNNNDINKYNLLKKQLWSIGKSYLIWSLIYLLITLVQYLINNWSLIDYLISSMLNLFIYGSYYHLWFYPTLLFIIVIFTVFYKNKNTLFNISIILYLIGVLGCSYYQLFDTIPILNSLFDSTYFELIRRIFMMGLPFFMLGANLNNLNIKIIGRIRNVIIIIGVFLLEIFIIHKFHTYQNITITFILYPLVIISFSFLLNNPLSNKNKLGKYCKKLSEIIYVTHPLIKLCLYNISNTLLFIVSLLIYMFIFRAYYLKTPSNK